MVLEILNVCENIIISLNLESSEYILVEKCKIAVAWQDLNELSNESLLVFFMNERYLLQ